MTASPPLDIIAEVKKKYGQLLDNHHKIERVAQQSDISPLKALLVEMEQLQNEVKPLDKDLYTYLEQYPEREDSQDIAEIMAMMHQLREQGQRIIPRLKSIQAVKRSELQQLNKGAMVFHGYRHKKMPVTGTRISNVK